MALIWIIFIGIALLGWIVQARLQNRFKRYSKIPLRNGMTGREVAEKMLHDNGIYDVQVISTKGALTDHYNPLKKTINLSEPVYDSYSVAAAAVAAHETGHALQHALGYAPLKMRSALVPIISSTSKWVMWVLLLGIILVETFPLLLWFGIVIFGLSTLFSFITLPVEKNATNRALSWLSSAGITDVSNHSQAEDALRWAGYTYVVAALSSLATLLYYIMIAMSGSRR
ncbi:MAG TPA: zinc metallopeptidase [Fermentimonas caenicola]|jgi:Zn-dependent membrane protease YugP|uniref:Zinc metallopeptidase n=1 Tax=Fermentimonas caenicola TaxID=1562970 RepID=A0A098C251_9BACT|nr:zinc metallopeptidase [Lascolabacillus sp.]MBP6175188.1 zinc metallopeptidase [Fermentimonas sp.]MDI9626390.1 zinc metallopeptidase [Bacteroidota bacterium]TAH61978.1 MAG: zinc metallopeptidase [Fermentimonas caenicola]MBP6195983.1 zinc metallopeptidase [Fermentimonas sp.]MBP7104549.1 zinc metallopeptidase [Fermentimonas sp.]